MKMTRRDFLKWSLASAAALKLDFSFERMSRALADDSDPPVLWLQGAGCSGCTLAFLNVTDPATADRVLLDELSLKFHATLSAQSGEPVLNLLDAAARAHAGEFILVVEGAIPTAENGLYCVLGERDGRSVTMFEALETFAPLAKAVVAAGTCAAFGGVAAAPPNRAGAKGVKAALSDLDTLVNLPGCPVHPTALVQTLLDVVLTGLPERDAERRPKRYFGASIHRTCERRGQAQAKPGSPGCYATQGCQGPRTTSSICPAGNRNGSSTWCIAANMPCIGCSRPEFPVNPLLSVRGQ